MRPIIVRRKIAAPASVVFATLTDIREYAKAVPHIVEHEFLTHGEIGPGTRFRETRLMNGKRMSNELEVKEFVPHCRARLVADAGGTIWDTVYDLEEVEIGKTHLTLTMHARAYRLLPKLLNPMIMRFISKAVATDMDHVKSHCETHRNTDDASAV